MPGLMSGDWKRSTVLGPQRLQQLRGQRRTYRPPRQPSTLPLDDEASRPCEELSVATVTSQGRLATAANTD